MSGILAIIKAVRRRIKLKRKYIAVERSLITMALPAAVDNYVKSIEFKKRVFRGVDETEAFVYIEEICRLFQRELAQESKKSEALAHELVKVGFKESVAEIEERFSRKEDATEEEKPVVQEISSLEGEDLAAVVKGEGAEEEKELSEFERLYAEIDELEEENRKLTGALAKAQANVEELKKSAEDASREAGAIREEYQQKYNEIKDLSSYIGQIRQDASVKAKKDAEEILEKAKQEALEIRRKSNKEKEQLDSAVQDAYRKKAETKKEMHGTVQKYGEIIESLRGDLDLLKDHLKKLNV